MSHSPPRPPSSSPAAAPFTLARRRARRAARRRGARPDGRRRPVPHRPRRRLRRPARSRCPACSGTRAPASSRRSARAVTRVAPGDHVLLSFTSCGGCAQLPRRPSGVLRHVAAAQPARRRSRRRLATITPGRRAARRPLLRPVVLRRAGRWSTSAAWSRSTATRRWRHWRRWAAVCRPESGRCGTCCKPGPGSTVVVLGAGAVGLSAVMAAALTPATTIIAVDKVPRGSNWPASSARPTSIDAGDEDCRRADRRDHRRWRRPTASWRRPATSRVLRPGRRRLAARGTAVIVGAPPFGTEVGVGRQRHARRQAGGRA